MKSFLFFLLIMLVVVVGLYFGLVDRDKNIVGDIQAPPSAAVFVEDGPTENAPEPAAKDEVPELVGSIYSREIGYRAKATKAAEDMMQHFHPDSYLRWEPISIEPIDILTGDFLVDGTMPSSISVSPFADVSVVADQERYLIMEASNSAIWSGKIRGSENGRVEISIVDVDGPVFTVRFRNYSSAISLLQSETPNFYVAIEANPHIWYSED